MPTHLNNLIRDVDRLSDFHIQYFAYQILRGLVIMHGNLLFPGTDAIDQLSLMIDASGSLSKEAIVKV